MTTPTSQLGMSHIQTEFGGSNPIALSEYYGVNANVASSGQIRMASFLGISGVITIQVLARTAEKQTYLVTANAWMNFSSASPGVVTGVNDSSSFSNYNWMSSGGTPSNYDIRYVRTAGTATALTSHSNNTWYNLNTNRTLYLHSPGGVFTSLTATVAIKWNANSTVISSATCNWYADATLGK